MKRYTLYTGDQITLAAVPESAIRTYLTSYKGNIEKMTVYSDGDVDLTEGISATEWLQENSCTWCDHGVEGFAFSRPFCRTCLERVNEVGRLALSAPTLEEVRHFHLGCTDDDMNLRGEGGISRALDQFLLARRIQGNLDH